MAPIVVTGATGQLGRRVVGRLAERDVEQRLVTRDLAGARDVPGATWVEGDYTDADAMRSVFDGAQTALFVSASEAKDREEVHARAVDAAVSAGLERIVYVSFLGAAPDATFTFARHHWHTEQHIRNAGLRFTFLRDSLYQDVLPEFVGTDGLIRGPAGDGRVGAVARDDIADAAVAVLLADGEHDGHTYDLTGPESLNFEEVAHYLTEAAGQDIGYHAETVEEAYASRSGFGAEDWEVTGWVTSYTAVAVGELDVISDAVERVAGPPPLRIAAYQAAHPEVVDRHRPRQ
jgi:NAD(P)H dehydrogenase (quinone)